MARRRDYRMWFTRRLALAIERSGLQKQELAKKVGVGPPVVSRWLSGQYPPTFDHLTSLATILGVSLDWLTGRVD